jgi:hypothetical protein
MLSHSGAIKSLRPDKVCVRVTEIQWTDTPFPLRPCDSGGDNDFSHALGIPVKIANRGNGIEYHRVALQQIESGYKSLTPDSIHEPPVVGRRPSLETNDSSI